MNLTITLENLDESIEALNDLALKLEQFPHDIARDMANKVAYPSTNPYVISQQGLNTVVNEGDGVAFEEFGAGFVAETWSNGTFSTEPGIYSRDPVLGKGTFEKHIAEGRPESEYRYNRKPGAKMQKATQTWRWTTEAKARLYFDR